MTRTALIVVILAAGGWLRFSGLSARSLWLDEAMSASFLRFDLKEVVLRNADARSVHPPLYFVALKSWASSFGDSETAPRSLAAACGVLAIAGAYVFADAARSAWPGVSPDRPVLSAAMLAFSFLQPSLSRPHLVTYGGRKVGRTVGSRNAARRRRPAGNKLIGLYLIKIGGGSSLRSPWSVADSQTSANS